MEIGQLELCRIFQLDKGGEHGHAVGTAGNGEQPTVIGIGKVVFLDLIEDFKQK